MTILIADDSRFIRERLRKAFACIPNATVMAETSNGREALTLLLELRPDIAVLDLCMPELSGLELIRRVKPHLLSTQLVVFTNYYDSHLFAVALAAGAHYVFDKVTEFEQMVNTIGQLCV